MSMIFSWKPISLVAFVVGCPSHAAPEKNQEVVRSASELALSGTLPATGELPMPGRLGQVEFRPHLREHASFMPCTGNRMI
ncbi:hypothetical protein [Burkholderia sp. PU8-34]